VEDIEKGESLGGGSPPMGWYLKRVAVLIAYVWYKDREDIIK
jgi:hypothetical protein